METTRPMRHITSSNPDQTSDNKVRNTKYTVVSFIPRVLLLQLKSFSSIYFFVLMFLQCFPKFTITSKTASLLPWAFVFVIALINEGIDDYKRHLRDRESNSSRCRRWTPTGIKPITSANIKAGDLILIRKNERVPADCVILKVDDASGEVFIRTDQLDGETDWKRRIAPAETQFCSVSVLSDIDLTVEQPHKNIYSFTGKLDIFPSDPTENSFIFTKKSDEEVTENNTEKINNVIKEGVSSVNSNEIITTQDVTSKETSNSIDNLAMKNLSKISVGIDLDNTIWANTVVATNDVLGMVIYTGHNTRSMMNTSRPRSKIGKLERELDRVVMFLSFASCLSALFFTLMHSVRLQPHTLVVFVHYLILFSYVIPISLKVTINLARIWYVLSIQSRPELKGVIVRTTSIQEELGRVSYVLTDKTGTLTRNEMVMKKLHLGTICYNTENTPDICELLQEVEIRAGRRTLFRKSKHLGTRVFELVEALALCHSVMPVTVDGTDEVVYQASSPDEQAIVEYAARVGFKLIRRDRVRVTIRTYSGERVYKILQTFPFNSDTKRMGIILERESCGRSGEKEDKQATDKHTPAGEIIFLEKGADTAMKPILKENDWAEEETDNMARDGLRTLLIGKRVMSREEYNEFAEGYRLAKVSVNNRAEKMLKQQGMIEKGLELLGLTGVEDRLQDRVKQSLENLRNAGIRVWMLTGDKIETAISIALSSRLMEKTDRYLVIARCTSEREMEQHMRMLRSRRYNALVIDGESLTLVIERCLDEFVQTVRNLHCVVGCRYTPTQKATMAAALRKIDGEVVCCIGDGGNDVSMITQADVGVGIEGREGNQASLAADFSVRTFADICDLLFWHGRRCYKNSSMVAHMIIHRGTISSIVQALFSALLLYAPTSFMQGNTPILFIFFTFFPLLAIIASSDISRHAAMEYPELYYELRKTSLLSAYSFLLHSGNSIFQAGTIVLWFREKFENIQQFRMLVLVTLIFNEQIMIFFSLERVTQLALKMLGLSLALFLISFFLFPEDISYEAIKGQYLNIALACLLASVLVISSRIYTGWIHPSSHRKLGLSP